MSYTSWLFSIFVSNNTNKHFIFSLLLLISLIIIIICHLEESKLLYYDTRL
jgi:hypothetical protein